MKRILSVLLATVLALGMTTAAAFAATGTVDGVVDSATGLTVSNLTNSSTIISGATFNLFVPDTALHFDGGAADPAVYSALTGWLQAFDGATPVTGVFSVTQVAATSTPSDGANLTVKATVTAQANYTSLAFKLSDSVNTTAASNAVTNLKVNPDVPETPTTFTAFSGTVPTTMTIGDTFTLSAPKTGFAWTTTGNGTQNYDGLATTAAPAGLTLAALTSDASYVYAKFTAATAGTTTLTAFGFTGGPTFNISAITIRTASDETITSYPANFTGTIPANMVVGETFTLKVLKSDFDWSDTGNGVKNFPTFTAADFTGVPTGLTISSVGNNTNDITVTFKATTAGTTTIANFGFLANAAKVIPAITIEAAITPTKPDVMDKGLGTNYFVNTKADLSNPDSLTVHAGDIIYLPFSGDMFGGNTKSAMTVSNLKSKKLTIRISSSNNSKLIDSYEIVTGNFNLGSGNIQTAAVKIEFVDPFRSIKDSDFDITFYPVFDGSRKDNLSITLSGTMEIETVDVDSSDDYVELAGKYVADVSAYVKLIEADLGEGVSLWCKMYSGKKYWGIATMDPTSADEAIFDKYSSIDIVFNLDTIGLSSNTSYVLIDGYGNDYYVYDANMKYLGKSNEKLAYSAKYYFSTRKLTEEEVEEDDDDDTGEPISENDLNPGSNKNDNPGTGR